MAAELLVVVAIVGELILVAALVVVVVVTVELVAATFESNLRLLECLVLTGVEVTGASSSSELVVAGTTLS